MASIADILIAKGNAQANAVSQRGNIYADLIRNLSSLPGQVIQQTRASQLQDMERQRLQSQIQSAASEQQLNALKVSDAQRQGQERSALDSVWGDPTVYQPDGSLNRDGIRQRITAANMGHLLPTALETADRLDESRAQLQQKQQALSESYRETLGKDALELDKSGNDPGLFHLVVADRAKAGVIPKEQADALLQVNTPEQVASITARWKAGSAAGKPDLVDIPRGGSLYDKRAGKVVATGTAEPLNESEIAMQAAGGDPVKAMGLLKPTESKTKDEFQTFKETYPQTLGMKSWDQLSPSQQQAGLKAYDAMRADPANARLASTQAQQNAIQSRAQTFQEQQAGRNELTNKVEAPYLTAKKSADTLRDVVAAAKAGNKFAGSMQQAEAAIAAVRAQGLSRIPNAEFQAAGAAGNTWDNIVGWVDKKITGQPVPENIQKDMTAFADVLERAAYKGYIEQHKAVTGRYKLDEAPLPPPSAATPAQGGAIKVGGFTLTPK